MPTSPGKKMQPEGGPGGRTEGAWVRGEEQGPESGHKQGGVGAPRSERSATSGTGQQSARCSIHGVRNRQGPRQARRRPTERAVPGAAPPPAVRTENRSEAAPRPGACSWEGRPGAAGSNVWEVDAHPAPALGSLVL